MANPSPMTPLQRQKPRDEEEVQKPKPHPLQQFGAQQPKQSEQNVFIQSWNSAVSAVKSMLNIGNEVEKKIQ